MGKKGKWLSTVKKVFSPPSSKDTKLVSVSRSKNGSFAGGSSEAADAPSDIKCVDAGSYGEQTKHVHPAPTAAPSDQLAAASAQVTNLSTPSPSKEEMAAVAIQTAFRGYLSRRALRALKGLVRLRSLVRGSAVMRQVMNTVKHMHLLTHVQSQIQSRRIRMLEENQVLHIQLILQKQAEELQMLQVEEEWDDSLKSKEQIETKLMSKREAAKRAGSCLCFHSSEDTAEFFEDLQPLVHTSGHSYVGLELRGKMDVIRTMGEPENLGRKRTTFLQPYQLKEYKAKLKS